MKIGTSLGRCVIDIYEKRVDMYDILLLTTRTDFDPTNDTHWANIWKGYTEPNAFSEQYWINYKDKESEFKEIVLQLHNTGRLHQPRRFGGNGSRFRNPWFDLMLSDLDLEENPAAKAALDKYKFVAGLVQ